MLNDLAPSQCCALHRFRVNAPSLPQMAGKRVPEVNLNAAETWAPAAFSLRDDNGWDRPLLKQRVRHTRIARTGCLCSLRGSTVEVEQMGSIGARDRTNSLPLLGGKELPLVTLQLEPLNEGSR
jgi:hypothetical protein